MERRLFPQRILFRDRDEPLREDVPGVPQGQGREGRAGARTRTGEGQPGIRDGRIQPHRPRLQQRGLRYPETEDPRDDGQAGGCERWYRLPSGVLRRLLRSHGIDHGHDPGGHPQGPEERKERPQARRILHVLRQEHRGPRIRERCEHPPQRMGERSGIRGQLLHRGGDQGIPRRFRTDQIREVHRGSEEPVRTVPEEAVIQFFKRLSIK